MKSAKSYKILLLIATLFLSIIMAFVCMNFSEAKADAVKGSDYFSLSVGGDDNIVLDGTKAVFKVTDGDVLSFDKKINVNGLKIESEIPDAVKKFNIKFVLDSYYVNGNVDKDGELDTSIERVYTLTKSESNYTVVDNAYEGTLPTVPKTAIESIAFSVDADNYFYAFNPYPQSSAYYKIKTDKAGNAFSKVSIEFLEVEGDSTVDFKIISVDQKSDVITGEYKQTFELTDGAFTKKAYPVVALSDSIFGENLNMISGYEYTASIEEYSLLGENYETYVKAVDDSILVKDNKLMLEGDGTKEIKICCKDGDNELVYGTYNVNVVSGGFNDSSKPADNQAPKYVSDDGAIEAFKKAYVAKLRDKDTGTYVALGSSQYLTLPSLKGLISDNLNSYEDLKLTVHYWTPSTSSSSSTLRIPLTEAGEYKFFISAEDKFGNSMNAKTDKADGDFFYYDKDGVYHEGPYSKYIFSFTVEDNYPIKVVAASQGKGYLNVSYTATAFDITSSAYNAEYELYYSASEIEAGAEGWVEIPKASAITDEEYSENGYTYEDVQAIAYNGSTTFTPNKTGYYKIVCTVTSTVSNRIESASTIIKIEEQPKVVVVPNNWLKDNVWSVVFLSVGTLCLIGIIVLLCIKPKEDKDND